MAKIISLLFMFLFAANTQLAFAQGDIGESIPACTEEELEEINAAIDNAAQGLNTTLNVRGYDNAIEILDDVTVTQRSFWAEVLLMPNCTEVYTRAYPMGRLLDEYSIGYGITIAALVELLKDEDSVLAERLLSQAEKHLREAQRMISLHLPELDELLGDEDYQ